MEWGQVAPFFIFIIKQIRVFVAKQKLSISTKETDYFVVSPRNDVSKNPKAKRPNIQHLKTQQAVFKIPRSEYTLLCNYLLFSY